MKIASLFLSLFLTAVVCSGQTYVHSVLPDNGSPVYTAVVSTASTVAPPAPVVFVGHFNKPGQLTDDILTFQLNQDGSVSASCLQNNNDGTFSQPIVTSAFPASALPLTAFKLIPSSDPTQTDWVLVGNSPSTLSTLHFSACASTVGSVSTAPAPPTSLSDPYNVSPTTIACGSKTISGPTVFGIANDLVWIFTPDGGAVCPNLAPLYASFAIPGPFNALFAGQNYNFIFSQVTEFPPSSLAPAAFNFVSYAGVNSFAENNWTNLEGQIFLGWIFSPDGNVVAVSATGSQIFFDAVTATGGSLPPVITNVGTLTLSAPPVGMVLGNFWNDTQKSDIAVAAGNQVTILTYAGAAGHPIWSLAETLTASGQIGAIDTGSLVPNGSDIVVQVGTNAETFSTASFTEVAPPPPQPPPSTYTLTLQTTGNGTVAQTPSGTTFPSGTVITLTETPGTGAGFSGWSGGCSGSQTVCTVTLSANTTVSASFSAASTPSLAVAPPSATVSAGNSASYAVTPQNFSTAPTLTASCSIPKGSCSIVGGQLVATTTAPTTTSAAPFTFDWYRLPWAPMLLTILVLAALYLIPIAPKRQTLRVGFAVAILFCLAACGGGSRTGTPVPQTIPGTPQGTYTIQIIAMPATGTPVSSQATLKVQ